MKNSNKITYFYIITSILLLGGLIFGGCYGIYLSVGLTFARSSVANLTEPLGATNVSFGGSFNFASSMTGIVVLSVALIILSIFDLISLIKQIVLFKQFKVVRESKLEGKIEKKVKSKAFVIFLAFFINLLSLAGGIVGVIINMRSYISGNSFWVLYVVDISVAVLSVISIVLLIIKLKKVKELERGYELSEKKRKEKHSFSDEDFSDDYSNYDVDNIEYNLLKLKYLKSSRMISTDEYNYLRENLLKIDNEKESQD